MSLPERVVVVGAGLAGAATGWALARRGCAVTVVEQERVRGAHASGRNAGLIRRVVEEPAVAELARRGAALLAAPPPDLARRPLYRRTGSVLLAGPGQAPVLREAAEAARAAGVAVELARPDAVDLRGLASPAGDGLAVLTPDDGVADPHEVLGALLDAAAAAGAVVRPAAPARLEAEAGRVTGVRVGGEVLPADAVVDAAGPWAAALAAEVGGLALPLVSYRRHLFWTGPLAGPGRVDPSAPWVWDVERGFYVRAESSGLLLCACDADPRPPEDAQALPEAGELLAEKIGRVAPELAHLPLARAWAGLRGFVPDGRFVVGWDPQVEGLFWVTALGGHGLTTSCAVGELAATGLAGAPDPLLAAFDPGRLVAQEVS